MPVVEGRYGVWRSLWTAASLGLSASVTILRTTCATAFTHGFGKPWLHSPHFLNTQRFPSQVWCHWTLELAAWKLLKADEIAVRAFDSQFNTQPSEPTWNLTGMMNNCWCVAPSSLCTSYYKAKDQLH